MKANELLPTKNAIADLYTRIVVAASLNHHILKEYAEMFISNDNLDDLEDADIIYEHKTLGELVEVLKQFLANH